MNSRKILRALVIFACVAALVYFIGAKNKTSEETAPVQTAANEVKLDEKDTAVFDELIEFEAQLRDNGAYAGSSLKECRLMVEAALALEAQEDPEAYMSEYKETLDDDEIEDAQYTVDQAESLIESLSDEEFTGLCESAGVDAGDLGTEELSDLVSTAKTVFE